MTAASSLQANPALRSTMQFGVIPVFLVREGKVLPQRPIDYPSEAAARRAAKIFAGVLGGAILSVRSVDGLFGGKSIPFERYGVTSNERPELDRAA